MLITKNINTIKELKEYKVKDYTIYYFIKRNIDIRNIKILFKNNCFNRKRLLGYIISEKKENNIIKICDLYIDKNKRNQGYGSYLLNIFLNENKNKIIILTAEKDTLFQYYNRFGFKRNNPYDMSMVLYN